MRVFGIYNRRGPGDREYIVEGQKVALPKVVDEALKTRVTVPVILILGVGWLGWRADGFTVSYLSQWFVTKAEAQIVADRTEKSIADVSGQVKELTTAFGNYVQRQEIIDINRSIANADDEIRALEREIADDGSTALRQRQLTELKTRRDALLAEKRCRLDDNVTNKSNCDLE